jgi:sn1-specific diacylglycerol lipase
VIVLLAGASLSRTEPCVILLKTHLFIYLAILCTSLLLELGIAILAMRGTILDTEPRAAMKYLLYSRICKYNNLFIIHKHTHSFHVKRKMLKTVGVFSMFILYYVYFLIP